MTNNERLAEYLSAQLNALGYANAGAASRGVGDSVSAGTLSNLLTARGVKPPQPQTLRHVADAFGISYMALMRHAGIILPTDLAAPEKVTLADVSTDELLAELRRRIPG